MGPFCPLVDVRHHLETSLSIKTLSVDTQNFDTFEYENWHLVG